jgi:glycosyltransferase involved in cell wall biosynthesis
VRIVHVIGSIAPRLGGPSKVVLEMSQALAAAGHTVDVVTTTLGDRGSWLGAGRDGAFAAARRLTRDGYSITLCRSGWPSRWVMSRELLGALRDLIPRATVVHIHSLYLFSTLVASRIAKRAGVPYIVRPHGTLDPYIRRRHRRLKKLYHALIEDATLRKAAAIHFTTREEEELAHSALPAGVRTRVVPLGIDVAEFAELPGRDAARRALGLDRDALVWVFLGRLNHKKGLDLLAPAFARFCSQVPRGRLILGGPDDDGLGKRFLEDCDHAGVRDRVIVTGLLDRAGMRQALAAGDFWILPSYSENFGVAVVEAMAARLPVLVTDRVNIWRAVEDAGAGIVTRPEVASVAEGMLGLARLSPAERRAMGERGHGLCLQSFSWRQSAQELIALYQEVAERNGP